VVRKNGAAGATVIAPAIHRLPLMRGLPSSFPGSDTGVAIVQALRDPFGKAPSPAWAFMWNAVRFRDAAALAVGA